MSAPLLDQQQAAPRRCVAYSAAQDGSISDIRAQIFNPDGSKSGTEFVVNSELSGPQVHPGVAALTGGGRYLGRDQP